MRNNCCPDNCWLNRSAIFAWASLFFALTASQSFAQAPPPSGHAAESTQQVTGKQDTSPAHQSSGSPELFDEPKFTVAGVADASGAGGHGSSAAVSNREGLAKAAVSLGAGTPIEFASETSEKALRNAVARQPLNFDANHQLGRILLDRGKPSEALSYLQQASKINATDYNNRYDLARAQAAKGEYEIARREAQSLLLERNQPGPHHLLGEIDEKLGHPLEAVREFQKAAELDPSEPNLFDWGTELLLHRANEPAIEVFAKGNRLYPQSARHLIGLAIALHGRGSYDQAQERLCKAADLKPEDPNPYLFMGRILSAQALASEGVSERLARFLKLHPDNAEANYFYALSLLNQSGIAHDEKKTLPAELLLKKAVSLNPKHTGAYLRLAAVASDRGDFAQAVQFDTQAVAVDPQSPEAHYALAQAYSRRGEKVRAEEELHIYQRVSKDAAQKLDRERREIQEFVVKLPDRSSVAQP